MKNLIKSLLEKFKTCKARENSGYYLTLSNGNKKLESNERVSFLIWNLPAVITCPFRTVLCEKFCYALKAEKQYKESCINARHKHLEQSKQADFVLKMIFTIETELARPKNKNKKIVFRIHESGDFYNMTYAAKWLDIIKYFENDNRIVFVAYTKSVTFFDGVKLPANFCLLASVWEDTTPDNLEIIKRNNFRIYTAYKGYELENAISRGFARCRCDDCATCGLCWNNYVSNIACEIH